jgi:DNA-binding winged helix-turn-helix (wHTH) protein/tetratricopeptide (TPR) repeat protein
MNRPVAARSIIGELAAREPFQVGNATIDPVSREARWSGGEERLQPQTLKVLLALLGKRGDVVTRDELVQLCWDGRFVGDDVINRSISLLRHFGERSGAFAIHTVPRAGYRLVESGRRAAARRGRRIATVAAIAAVAAAIAAAFVAQWQATPRSPTLRVAVEPFAYDANDEQSRRLAEQVRETSIRMLTETGVTVYDAGQRQAARAGADFVLSGTVSGRGTASVATVRLDDPLRRAIVLSRRIPAQKSDPAALPDQVGAQLSAALSWVGPLIRLDESKPSDAALIANLLNTNLTNFDSQRAYQLARRTAPSAPNSAIAQLTLASATGMNLAETPPAERARALADGRTAAERALRLAPKFGNSYIPWCLLHAEVRLAECEARLRNGLAADPQAPAVGRLLSHLLRNVGRIDEAVPIATDALAKDAYVPGRMASLLVALEASGQSAEADALFKRGVRLWPSYDGLFWNRLSGILARGDLDALANLEKQVGPERLPAQYPSVGELAGAMRTRSLRHVRELCRQSLDDLKAMECMLALARLHDLDAAFQLADRLYPRRIAPTTEEEEALWLANPSNLDTIFLTGPGAAPMRGDPRFLPLAERLGLARYWRSNGLPDFCTRDHEPICVRIARRR